MRGGEKRREIQPSFHNPWSSVGWNSSSQDPKVHRLYEGYAWVQKKEGFHRRSKGGDFEKSKFSRLEGVLETSFGSTTLKEVGILSTFVYLRDVLVIFPPLGAVWLCFLP